jgi:hypothetical protein
VTRDPETTARLELNALEKMIGALCRHTEQLVADAQSRGSLNAREAALQLEAFAERRTQAEQLLAADSHEPAETRIARLERLAQALDSSRAYFRAGEPEAA